MNYEKFYVEIFLVILLLVLLNGRIQILSNLCSDISGKIIFVLLISFLSLRYGTTCGLLGAFVYLLLNNKYKEAMSPPKVPPKPKGCKKDRDCGACQYKCNAGNCEAKKLDGSEYIRENFIGSRSSHYDRESVEDKINKQPHLKTISAQCH